MLQILYLPVFIDWVSANLLLKGLKLLFLGGAPYTPLSLAANLAELSWDLELMP
jgi:hypothetical protein